MDKLLKKIIWLFVLAPAIYLAFRWNNLPEKVPMHYDLKGNIDRYGNKNELLVMLLIITAVNLLVFFLLTNAYRIDKKNGKENKSRYFRIAFVVSVFIAAVQCLIIYSSTRADLKFSASLLLAGIGLLFAFMGNYMYNIKPNYFAGFRLSWTLKNEENWKKTHLLAGKLWFAGGLFLAVICLFLPVVVSFIIFFAVIIIMLVLPGVYSYRLYRKQKGIT